jgi:hypothetical protein
LRFALAINDTTHQQTLFCGLLIEFQTARNYLRYACIIYCVAALMCSGQDARERERVLRHKQCAHSGIVQFWNACTIEDVGMAELTYSAQPQS